ncbi:MAG TPA: winged helix-turn-helix transcriptional regulator [Clostridiales bacterium]|nr:winged helix-turn-helix transcriptional regulator [Clostridiales bacterium]
MAKWTERVIVSDSPNFYMEAVELVDDYFQWLNESDENKEKSIPWEDRHLVSHPENFTLSPSEVDQLFNDVHRFLSECRKNAAPVIYSRQDLQPYFAIKASEHTKEMPGFLKEVLVMSDVQSAKDLTRDEFVTCCLFCLHELSDKLHTGEFEIGSPEEQELYNKLTNPDFDMKEIFDAVTNTSLSDKEQMLILRLFQDIDAIYIKVRETLLLVEQICRENYHIAKDRFANKVKMLKADQGKTYYNEWIERAKLQIDDFRTEEPIYLEVGIIAYGALSIRFTSWQRTKLRLSAGLLFDELCKLEDKGKFRDKMTQKQLKAIADPTRYKIIRQLSIRPQYVQEMADALNLTAATLSHHLAVLQQVLLVGVSIKGRKSYYCLNADELEELGRTLQHMAQRSRMEE